MTAGGSQTRYAPAMRRRAGRFVASIARRAAALRSSEHQRQRQREAGRRPADPTAVLVVASLALVTAFTLGLVLGLVLHCGT
jgi:uncharacterized membrane protein